MLGKIATVVGDKIFAQIFAKTLTQFASIIFGKYTNVYTLSYFCKNL